MNLPWLDPKSIAFPDTKNALTEPNGLLAAGGGLSENWLIEAYSKGIFPWFNEGDPILWWSPSPRMVIYPYQLHISKSLKKALKRGDYKVTINKDFKNVLINCAATRDNAPQLSDIDGSATWITAPMIEAYLNLHEKGFAHSIEVWKDDKLAGGLYGVALGDIFFGESMFSLRPNSSKIAISHLVEHLKQWQYKLIDCQVYNDHLSSLGAIEIDKLSFEQELYRSRNSNRVVTDEWIPQEITLQREFWLNSN